LIRQMAGVLLRPRSALADARRDTRWPVLWAVIIGLWAAAGTWLLSTEIGQQALVDERVRVIEAFGGSVSDEQYAALQAAPPWWVYITSGSRLLLTPPATILAAFAMWLVARRTGEHATFIQMVSVAVHASIVLLVGQLVATPLHYLRESLTSPLNLAAVLPLVEDGTPQARFFGTMDVFVLWWTALLAIGLSVTTGVRARRYFAFLVAAFAAFAGVVALAATLAGGA
jgi:hypothetical protein